MTVGKIINFTGSWGSGIATLVVENLRTRELRYIHCENAQTVRALAAAFGEEVIGAGHTVNVEALRGKVIDYRVDGLGLLSGFKVVKQ